jgi:hypothetical protein
MAKQKLPEDRKAATYKQPAPVLRVSVDGPDPDNVTRETEQGNLAGGTLTGWCRGDVDFEPDGSLFIRNPYLANAIEKQLKQNQAEVDAAQTNPAAHQSEYADASGHIVKQVRFVFRMVRDEGFSGPKVNIVC